MESINLNFDELFGDDEAEVDEVVDQAADEAAPPAADDEDEVDDDVLRALDPKRAKKGAAKTPGTKKPRLKLDSTRLMGAKGLKPLLEKVKELKLEGEGHEVADLGRIMSFLELWGHRLYPKANMNELTERLEWLGGKADVKTLLKKMRLGDEDENELFGMQLGVSTGAVKKDEEEEEFVDRPEPEFDPDAFGDAGSGTSLSDEVLAKIEENRRKALIRRQEKLVDSHNQTVDLDDDRRTPSPPPPAAPSQSPGVALSAEVLAKIEANRQKALQRRQDRLLNQSASSQ